MNAEQLRLDASNQRAAHWKRWGPYLSERAWGTVREDYSAERRRLGVLPARPRPLARLPLERGRPRRDLRPPPDHLLRAGALERARPDPEGAAVRPDRHRRQPRRGRQGVLLLSRQHADALVHEVPVQVSAAGVSVRRSSSRRTGGAAAASPSTSCSTPASSTTTATSTSSSSTRRPSPEDILFRITVVNRGRSAAPLDLLPTVWFRNTWSWGRDNGRTAAAPAPRRADRGRRLDRAARTACSDARTLTAEGSPELLFTENETNSDAALRRDARTAATSRTASTTSSCTAGSTRSTRRDEAPRPRRTITLVVDPGETVVIRLRLSDVARPAARARRDFDRVFAGADPTRPTSSTPTIIPVALGRRRARRDAPGVRRAAVVEAVLPLRRARLARRAIPASPPPPAERLTRPQHATGRTSTTPT